MRRSRRRLNKREDAASLTFRKRVRKNVDHVEDGVLYVHHFGTGWQELIFPNHEAAWKYAKRNGCEFKTVGDVQVP